MRLPTSIAGGIAALLLTACVPNPVTGLPTLNITTDDPCVETTPGECDTAPTGCVETTPGECDPQPPACIETTAGECDGTPPPACIETTPGECDVLSTE